MGLFRCPKCDSICHTDEEVCHICGYRLKPEQPKVEEPKVEAKPQEAKKEETNLNQKFTIGSGFSRKSVFNSVDFDKKEEPKIEKPVEEVKVNDDPFASFDAEQEKPKEDIFEAFEKQSSSANEIFKEQPVQEKTINEKPIEPEVVKVEPKETKPIDIEPVVKPVVQPKAEEPKVATPKVEEKPKPTTNNPYTNNGYKQPSSASTGAGSSSVWASAYAGSSTAQTPKKGEPIWVREWRNKIQKNKRTAIIWGVILFCLFIIFLILTNADQKEVFHSYSSYSSYYNSSSGGYYSKEAKGGWVFLTVITGIGFVTALIVSVFIATGTLYVKEIEGYYVLIYGHSNDYKLVLENRVVDRYYSGGYGNNASIKLTGKLPNNKVVLANIYYKNYNRVIKVELLENKQNSSK